MILVTFAVPFESAGFRQRPVSRHVRILHTGVGAARARAAMERALPAIRPNRVIASGFAGALIADLRVGDIVGGGPRRANHASQLASAPEVLDTAAKKQTFQARTGADAVDMETDVIRECCAAAGVPLAVLRAISDGSEDDLGLPPDLLAALSDHPLRAAPELAWTLLMKPSRRRAFFRLVRDCHTAQRSLANALEKELLANLLEHQ